MRHHRTKTGETILAYVVLAILSFLCLFFFYILIVNSTRSHADLQKGFSWLPGNYFLENLKNVANDGSFPMFKGILNSLIVSSSSAALCTYFSALTAYGLYAYNFKLKKFAFTFIMAILVMPTQVTAMGFLRLMTNMGLYDTLWPLIIPSIASPAVFYFMYSYLKSSLPLSLVEAARIDGANDARIYTGIMLPLSKPVMTTIGLFAALGYWNNWTNGLYYITDSKLYTIQVYLKKLMDSIQFLKTSDLTNESAMLAMQSLPTESARMAIALIALLPILLVYPAIQGELIKGMVVGGVKG